jgi:hypothetical protein
MPAPPPTVNAPDVALVEAVVAVTATTPPEEIVIALMSLAEPSEPPSWIVREAAKVGLALKLTTPPEEMLIASKSEADPIRPPSLITRSPATWKSPIELSVALAVALDAAVSDTPVVNTNLVALADALNVPSAIA